VASDIIYLASQRKGEALMASILSSVLQPYPLLLIIVVGIIIAFQVARRVWPALTVTTMLQIGLIGCGVLGAFAHAFPTSHKPDEDFPVVDLEGLAWFALVPIGLLLPRISKIKLGEAEIELVAASKEAVKIGDDLASLMLNWTGTLTITEALIRRAKDVDEAAGFLWNFVRDRLGEMKEAIEADEGDVRISVWIYDDQSDKIDFYYSNEIIDEATQNASFARGEGMLGQAFVEQRTWNEPNALQLAAYTQIVARPQYKAVYCGPITFHGAPKGMLCIDKKEEAMFGDRADTIAKSLEAILAAAFEELDRYPLPNTPNEVSGKCV